jgi:hypothetical protein
MHYNSNSGFKSTLLISFKKIKKMKVNYSGTIKGSRLEMEPLNNYISDAIASSTPLYFTLVDGTVFNTKFTAFELKDDAYHTDRADAQAHRQAAGVFQRELEKFNTDIAQYVKTVNHENTKKIAEWGIPLRLGKLGGKVTLSRKLKDVEMVSIAILFKHTLDGANSILSDFDMVKMQAILDAYVLERANYKNSQNKWRSASISRRYDMAELRKMQHLIARELIKNPTFNDRDLEQFGYTLIENHDYGSNEIVNAA